ncbi:unnamed protein product, partial [marine sediment metagenome]
LIFDIVEGKTGSLRMIDPDTGLQSPGSTGDDHNDWSDPTKAYSKNNDWTMSGTASTEYQDYYNFGFGVPVGAIIDGIEVRYYIKSQYTFWLIRTALSWDGGSTYTSSQDSGQDSGEKYYTEGSDSDNWGRTWDASEVSNTSFRVRMDNGPSRYGDMVDHIEVKVYYTEAALIYELNITDPTIADPESVSSGDNITLTFNFTESNVTETSGVSINNITIGGVHANILESGEYGVWEHVGNVTQGVGDGATEIVSL